jgi:hypothetical protein
MSISTKLSIEILLFNIFLFKLFIEIQVKQSYLY